MKCFIIFFLQPEDGIGVCPYSVGLGEGYRRQVHLLHPAGDTYAEGLVGEEATISPRIFGAA